MIGLAILAATGLALPGGSRGVPFEKAAKDFMASHGLADKKPEEVEVESVLQSQFLHGRFGAFEILFPASALEKRAPDLKDCAAALLASQEKLLDWSKPLGKDQKALRADLKVVTDWVKSWRPAALASARDAGGKDVTAVLLAPEPVVAASGRLADVLGKGAALGVARDPVAIRMILEPSRKDFVELACFVGATNEEDKATYWVDGIADWGSIWIQDVQVVALEYSVPNHQPGDYTSGMSMNEKDPTGMQQQVVQFSLLRYFHEVLGETTPVVFVGGLSMNLVIDQFGEISTRLDGDLRGKTTAATEIFIAGAVGDGVLAKNSAETRWRENRGRDRFLHILHQAQKEGDGLDKAAKNRAAVFGVRTDSGGDLSPLHAPFFLGEAEEVRAADAKYQGDTAELQRAYKCAFVSWLQTKAGANDKTSKEKFAQLLAKIAEPEGNFEAAFPAVYENAPLSDAEAGKDSLEGKFLLWLSKQK
jgi:hypothetical protein